MYYIRGREEGVSHGIKCYGQYKLTFTKSIYGYGRKQVRQKTMQNVTMCLMAVQRE